MHFLISYINREGNFYCQKKREDNFFVDKLVLQSKFELKIDHMDTSAKEGKVPGTIKFLSVGQFRGSFKVVSKKDVKARGS